MKKDRLPYYKSIEKLPAHMEKYFKDETKDAALLNTVYVPLTYIKNRAAVTRMAAAYRPGIKTRMGIERFLKRERTLTPTKTAPGFTKEDLNELIAAIFNSSKP